MVAIYDFKSWNGMTYYYDIAYSGHSWMGILTMALWVLQFFAGLWLHVWTTWPPMSQDRRQIFVEIHHFFGYSVYAMGLAACATGLQDMQSSDADALSAANPEPAASDAIEVATNMLTASLSSMGGNMTDDSLYLRPPHGTILSSVGKKIIFVCNLFSCI